MAIITVSREYGSDGRTVAQKAAEALGYEHIDKDLLVEVARKAQVPVAEVERYDEQPEHSALRILRKFLTPGYADTLTGLSEYEWWATAPVPEFSSQDGQAFATLDEEVYARLTQEVLTEMTDNIGSAFLGLTIACARCHDHKFDAFSQQDYFRLQSFFAATQPVDVTLASEQQQQQHTAELEKWQHRFDKVTARLEELREKYRSLSIVRLVKTLTGCRPAVCDDPAARAVLVAAVSICRSARSSWRAGSRAQ